MLKMENHMEKIKEEKGAVITEAVICFPFFIFAVIMFVSLIDICMTQAKITTALNVAAKEISEYSYLYILTGANQGQSKLNENAETARSTINDTLDGMNKISSTLLNDKNAIMSETIDTEELYNDINSIGNTANDVFNKWKEELSDPKKFIKSVGAFIGNEAWEKGKMYLFGEVLGKAFMAKNLQNGGSSGNNFNKAEQFLKHSHIVPQDGSYLGGLDFNNTIVFSGGDNEVIQLVVTYEIHVVKLLNIDFNFKIQQSAITKAWGSGMEVQDGDS